MNEADYWSRLEHRIDREFAGMAEGLFRNLWCDGFLAEQYHLNDSMPRITGRAWICSGSQQDQWAFTLVLPHPVGTRDEIPWASLLPPDGVTRWVAVDQSGQRLEIEPAAAVPDLA